MIIKEKVANSVLCSNLSLEKASVNISILLRQNVPVFNFLYPFVVNLASEFNEKHFH